MLKVLLENSFTEDNVTINICVIELSGSYLILISDTSEYGLGTIVMGVPPLLEGLKPVVSGTPVFGFERSPMAKISAEMFTSALGKPSIIFFSVKNPDINKEYFRKILVDAFRDTVSKVRPADRKKTDEGG